MARDAEPEFVAGVSDLLIDPPRGIAKGAGQRVVRHDSRAHLIGDKDNRRGLRGQRPGEGGCGGLPVLIGQHQVRQPERQAIHQSRLIPIAGLQGAQQVARFLNGTPFWPSAVLVQADSVRHFSVMSLCGGDVDRRRAHGQRHTLRQGAFARACSARDEDRLSHAVVTNHDPIWLKSPEMMSPDASELLLIRHAPALHGGRLCGRRDVPAELGDPGLWAPLQALVAQVPHRISSPALRCRQTAQALWPDAEIDSDARLWEQDFGAHEGLSFDEIPDIGLLSQDELADHRPPQGESFAAMVVRVRPALEQLADRARAGGPVAVVAHAGTARAALALAMGRVPPALGFEVAPWSVTRLRAYPGGLSVIATNWRPL